jgi:hypothetical protein
VSNAQQVNCQEMEELNKTLDAEYSNKDAMLTTKFNSDRLNASNANHAQLDKSLLTTNVLLQ